MRLVRHHQIPLARGERGVVAEVGVGRDDDPGARVVGILQARDVEPEHAPGLLPVLDDLVVRRDDQGVRLAREREALDDAQPGPGLPGPGPVREEHAVAVRLGKALLGLEHILLLARQ